MCGRYAASASRAELVEVYQVDQIHPLALELPARFNIAPTDPVQVVAMRSTAEGDGPVRTLMTPRWGLVPSWSKDPRSGARLINARSETVAEKPSFRKAFTSRRCLVPAIGYYEWYTLEPEPGSRRPRKQPFWIHPTAGIGPSRLMTMAGLYEFWRDRSLPEDHPYAWLTTCTIITTTATDDLGMIHDRMPMQVRPEDWADWLDPSVDDAAAAHELMHAPGPEEMTAWAVSTRVNKVGQDGPDLVEPIEPFPVQGLLV